jgi:hypothetical protein
MRITRILFPLLLVSLTACSTTASHGKTDSSKADPETVLVTYHVKPGKEADFQEVISRAWEIYRNEHLVFAKPHVVVRDNEAGGQTRFVEIFTWISHSGPEHAPDSVKSIWNQEQSLCEARAGHASLEGGEVDMLTPKPH